MGVITLISDMGDADHYVAAVKASLLNLAPESRIVDISHKVKPFDIHGAAFRLNGVKDLFPMGTVHLIGIRPELTPEQNHLVIHHMSQYFVGSDSGIFGLIFDEEPEDIYEVNLPLGEDWNFPMRGVLAVCTAHLAKGGVPELLGKKVSTYRKATPLIPFVDEDKMLAHVKYIDHYGNVYTDVTRAQFDAVRRGRDFELIPKRSSYGIKRISSTFYEMTEGDIGAMWASNDLLMLVIRNGAAGHGGGAAQLFGFQLNDIIRIEFHGEANS